MKHAIAEWPHISRKLKGRRMLLLLDFDGTLAPIASSPDKVVFSKNNRVVLQSLASVPTLTVGIISGRDIDDIKKIVGIKRILYAGSHGLQVNGPGIKWRFPIPPEYISSLMEARSTLVSSLKRVKGILIEDKEVCFAVHYRNVPKDNVRKVQDIINKVLSSYVNAALLKKTNGKKVVEIAPAVLWDKGELVSRLISGLVRSTKNKAVVSFYVGDDITDETVFKVLNTAGITVVVGKKSRSDAKYYLKNTCEVSAFLLMILKLFSSRQIQRHAER